MANKKHLQVICTYCPDLGMYHMSDERSTLDSHFSDAALVFMVEECGKQGREEEKAVLIACAGRAKEFPHKMVLLYTDRTFEVCDPVKDPDPIAGGDDEEEGEPSGGG